MPLGSLPDDHANLCVARIPIHYYRSLSTVSPKMRSIVASEDLYRKRKLENLQEPIVYASIGPNWYSLGLKPMSKTASTGFWFMCIPKISIFPRSSNSMANIGSRLYMLGRQGISKEAEEEVFSTLLILNCVSNDWKVSPPMNHPRKVKDCYVCAIGDSIIVVGGCEQEGEGVLALNVEVLDTKNADSSWVSVADPEVEQSSKVAFVGPSGGNLLGVWLFSGQQMQGSKHSLHLQDRSWKKEVPSMLTPSKSYYHTLLVGNIIVRIFDSVLHWYDEDKGQFVLVDGFNRLKKRPLSVVGSSGSLLAFGDFNWKRKRTVDRVCLWAEEITLKKDGERVVGRKIWTDTTLELEGAQFRGLRILGSAVTH